MGFSVEEKSSVKLVADDLKRLVAQFTVKSFQKLETDSTFAFLGLPVTADPSMVNQLVDEVLKPLE